MGDGNREKPVANNASKFPLGPKLPEILGAFGGAALAISHNPETGNRVEDIISTVAAFVGESAMRLAGEFDFDGHNYPPGKAIFSAVRVNDILFGGESLVWIEMAPVSVFGFLYRALIAEGKQPWPRESFPDVAGILQRYATSRRKSVFSESEWSKAPLSVPPKHFPSERLPPLRGAYEMRQFVFKRWEDEDLSPLSIMNLAKLGTVAIMIKLRPYIAPEIGLTLAFETINAMSKTVPFLPKHMLQLAKVHQKAIQLMQ